MKTAVIVDSVRTGLAKSHRGGFNITRPDDMLAHIINAMLDRNPNLSPEVVEDVIMVVVILRAPWATILEEMQLFFQIYH